jgi:prophage regulatory protein
MTMHARIEAADRLLNLEEVKAIVGLGKTAIYRMMRAGEFPMACKAGGCSTRWSENECRAWVAAQLASRAPANDRT